ncbi:c-type cytochrome [Ramlibacter pallidus]|uniref:Cytochrome c n=1 Tax=Ramlibacter pallidus TaxID=2780087 RepID=A0ABR9RYC5_9BURK|nr:cytochrome c [Ramlibacter pallidus]MBE7366228.1 cytochrome c [Ramlibacter pallidus]
MGKWMKRLGLAAGLLAVLVAGAVFAGLQLADRKMQRRVEVKVQPVAYTTDAAAVERGRYLFASRGCVDCHGANGGGRTFVEEADGLKIRGPNITRAAGGVVGGYQPQDWVRAIRHGVAPDGRPLMIMPSEDYNRFTDADLAALVAYVRSMPPAEGGAAELRLPVPVRVLYGFGAIQDAAAKIDHALPPAQPVAEGVNVAHGAYVANMCLGCHGPQLAGGRIPGGPPDWPAASNLTPGEGTVMTRYPDADALLRLFRTGKRHDGSEVKVMPFNSLREMSDTDVRALHLYLRGLPPKPQG